MTSESKGGTVYMVIAIRQLQDKCVEQHQDLTLLFTRLTKAFDRVNRAALWVILSKLGCSPRFIEIIPSFHGGMLGGVIEAGDTSEPFLVFNAVTKVCVLAPTLFRLPFRQPLSTAPFDSPRSDSGVKVYYRTYGVYST